MRTQMILIIRIMLILLLMTNIDANTNDIDSKDEQMLTQVILIIRIMLMLLVKLVMISNF